MAIEIGLEKSNLGLIRQRSKFIEDTKRTRNLYRPRQLFHSLLLRGIALVCVAKTQLTGQQNLDFVKNRLGQEQFTIAASHSSDADHQSLDHTLRKRGYPEVADRLVFAAGLKMWDRPETRWGMPALSTFPVAAPGYFEEAAKMAELAQSEQEQELIKRYTGNMLWLNTIALRVILNDWKVGKVIVVVYPETSRSRDDLLKRGREEMNVYFKRGKILPVMSQGPGEVFPPGKGPRWDKLGRREFEVKVATGPLIDTGKLQQPRTLEWLAARGANPVDFVMSRIAVLNPDHVDSKYRPLYQSLTEDIPQGLLLAA